MAGTNAQNLVRVRDWSFPPLNLGVAPSGQSAANSWRRRIAALCRDAATAQSSQERIFRGILSHAGVAALTCWLMLGTSAGADALVTSGDNARPFRLAFMASMFTEVNESDARAAMKVWIMTVAKERGIPVDPDPPLYRTLESALAAARTNEVDGLGLTTPELRRMAQAIRFDRLAVAKCGDTLTERYVLLVREDSGLSELKQLERRPLLVLQNPRMSLAVLWLDTLLLENGLKPATGFWSRITFANKATKAALPVFFRQADACLITRRAFETLIELNPQVGKQLRVLAMSPEVIPAAFAFRADFRSPYREQILSEMKRLPESPAGQQILMLTQADGIVEQPVSCLDSAFTLLATHDRLCGGTNAAKAAVPETEPRPPSREAGE